MKFGKIRCIVVQVWQALCVQLTGKAQTDKLLHAVPSCQRRKLFFLALYVLRIIGYLVSASGIRCPVILVNSFHSFLSSRIAVIFTIGPMNGSSAVGHYFNWLCPVRYTYTDTAAATALPTFAAFYLKYAQNSYIMHSCSTVTSPRCLCQSCESDDK
jgi:hypothetical protein